MKSLRQLWRTLSTSVQGRKEEAALDKEIESSGATPPQEEIDQQMNQIIDRQTLSVPPNVAMGKEVSPPPRKEFLFHSCVVCHKFQGVTLVNVNYNGLKRKACDRHKSHYPKWKKGSHGFNS